MIWKLPDAAPEVYERKVYEDFFSSGNIAPLDHGQKGHTYIRLACPRRSVLWVVVRKEVKKQKTNQKEQQTKTKKGN